MGQRNQTTVAHLYGAAQPDDGGNSGTDVSILRIHQSAPPKGHDDPSPRCLCCRQYGDLEQKLVLEGPEDILSLVGEDPGNALARPLGDCFVEINEIPIQQASESTPYGALATAHEASQVELSLAGRQELRPRCSPRLPIRRDHFPAASARSSLNPG